MPVRKTKPYLVDSILRMISRYWFTWGRETIIGTLADTRLGDALDETHVLSDLVARYASGLNAMPYSKLEALHDTLRHRLPRCKTGPRPYMELTEIVTWVDVRRALERYVATREDHLPWLFVSERGQQMVRRAVNYIIARQANAPVSAMCTHTCSDTPAAMPSLIEARTSA